MNYERCGRYHRISPIVDIIASIFGLTLSLSIVSSAPYEELCVVSHRWMLLHVGLERDVGDAVD